MLLIDHKKRMSELVIKLAHKPDVFVWLNSLSVVFSRRKRSEYMFLKIYNRGNA